MESDRSQIVRGKSRPFGVIAVVLTLLACVAALIFRTPIRSRYWAWQVVTADGVAERAAPLTRLCNAGEAGRWGTGVLLGHSEAEIRQFGVLVLQHLPSEWSRRRLLGMLEDPSAAVREMAALGLAIHGQVGVIPELERLYTEGDAASASAACIALERLAGPEAVSALGRLAGRPADTRRRAALVDALEGIGTPSCAAVLLELLGDHRRAGVPTRAAGLLERLGPVAAEHNAIQLPPAESASRPAAPASTHTVAERAAAALARITGLNPRFGSDLPKEKRDEAERIWRHEIAARQHNP